MSNIFFNCTSLKSLPDISKWNTENVISMKNMFYHCNSLTTFPDISIWNTSNVIDMSGMFCHCSSFLSLPDLSNWNLNKITDISGMFCHCNSLIKHFSDILKLNNKNDEDINDLFEIKIDYKIPGFFNIYQKISNFVNEKIVINYLNIEDKLRNIYKENIKLYFHKIEDILLSCTYNEISRDKIIFENMNEVPHCLILKYYIHYYLDKNNYIFSKCVLNYKLVQLLLNLRFNEENNIIIKNNKKQNIKIILIEIIWLESNKNYISIILQIFYCAKNIFKNENKLYNMLEKKIFEKDMKYVIDDNKFYYDTKEVDECFWIFLACLGHCIISNEIKLKKTLNIENNDEEKIDINKYQEILKEIYLIFQILDQSFYLHEHVKEMYIIEELIDIIELQKLGKINIETIENLRNLLLENNLILKENKPYTIGKIIDNFERIYYSLIDREIENSRDENYCDKYYRILRKIFEIEIKKIRDIDYRCYILEKILSKNEIIKKSIDIFQFLLRNYLRIDSFQKTIQNLSKSDDSIVKLFDHKLEDNFILSETLLYLFEKNSIIYLNTYLNKRKNTSLDGEPLEIYEECVKFLSDYMKDRLHNKSVNITKLYCFGYIKVFCFKFISMLDEFKPKFKDPNRIIKSINNIGTDNLKNMILLYILKIIYNKNKMKINVFSNKKQVKKYKLDLYNNFQEFKFQKNEFVEYDSLTLDSDEFERIYKIVETQKNQNFEKTIEDEINFNDENIDNFYMMANNLIFPYLKEKGFEKSDTYRNFYNNICLPFVKLNKINNKKSFLIKILFSPEEYEKTIQKYEIINIEGLLYGYRYCLNEISNEGEEENEKGEYIYSSIYDKTKFKYLSNKFYPGSDTKNEPYYELYNKIIKHFREMPNEGCFVCLCKKGFYHSVPAGFPGCNERNLKCPHCKKEIGSIQKEINKNGELIIVYEMINRNDYYRILKDGDEIDYLKSDRDKRDRLDKINYMTLKEFKEKYIVKLYENEKGIPIINKNYFEKEGKTVRELSQISYRLLNFILYSHLFFAKLITQIEDFDKFLPKDMNWGETLNKCWILLNKELFEKGVTSIEIFMNFIFKDLFYKLHEKKCIETYDELIEFEEILQKIINENIEKSLSEIQKYKTIINDNIKDKRSVISLIKEIYDKNNYDKLEYPFYEYFYYTEYLNENYLEKILNHRDRNEYPILNYYLEFQKTNNDNETEDDKYPLSKLYMFNTVLNLFNEKYLYLINREKAQKILIKDTELYKENTELIDQFMKYYNNLKIKNNKGEFIQLNIDENYLSDFFIDENNEIGKSYKKIYKNFIDKQNQELTKLLTLKNNKEILEFSNKNKINIQTIKENEILNLCSNKNFSFINILFDNSYRKLLDTNIYKDYERYEINIDNIETTMTDLLLKNKKLLNNYISYFIYNDDLFNNEINEYISDFNDNYKIIDIDVEDKKIIFTITKDYKENKNILKNIINDFINLIKYLNEIKNNYNANNKEISEYTIITEILKNLNNISKEFNLLFENRINFTVNKITSIFDYYLKLIFNEIKEEIKNYQISNNNNKLDEKTIDQLDEYYEKEHLIKKEDLKTSLRLFMSLVMFREENKENKIKNNCIINVIDYLNTKDLWNKNLFENENFYENLNELKKFNIHINQILWLYNYTNRDNNDNYFEEMEKYMKEEENNNNKDVKEINHQNENQIE